MIGATPLRVRYDKAHGFIRGYDGTRYLVLFDIEKSPAIFDRIRYLVGVKIGITYVISHNSAKIKVDSYNSFPLEKALTLHNVKILTNSTFNKD